MDIDKLTIGEAREIASMFQSKKSETLASGQKESLNGMIGTKVIIRTYSAGVWFGTLAEKAGSEVILEKARRMYRWWAAESISLSAVALYGIYPQKSKIVEAVPSVWLEAIEIIPCSNMAIKSLEGAENVKAQ